VPFISWCYLLWFL
jgi:hypothetical protein